jgi:hypothetical protein
LTFSKLKRTVGVRNAGGRNAHRRTASSRPRCRSRLAVIRRDGVPGARSGSDPDPNWAIGNAAAGATSAHHSPSAAAPPPKTLHQVVCRAVPPSVPCGRRGVYAGAFPRRVPVAGIKHVRLNDGRILTRSIGATRRGNNLSAVESPKLLSVAQFVGRRKRPARRDGGGANTTA